MKALLTMLAVLHAGAAHADALTDIAPAVPACDTQRAHCFGLQLHVVTDEASTVATAAWIAAQVALANQHFAASNIAFELAGVDALPATVSHVATRADRNALARGTGRLGGGAIHVYLVGALDDVDVPGEARNGVAWRLPKDSRKFVIVAATAKPLTLAHELGHVFGLPHSTFADSIMNKAPRTNPPVDERSFATAERVKIEASRKRLIRSKFLAARL